MNHESPKSSVTTQLAQASGTAEICFVSKLLDDYEDIEDPNPELEEDIKALGAITYLGWFDCALSSRECFSLLS